RNGLISFKLAKTQNLLPKNPKYLYFRKTKNKFAF
ncbi:MAG: hypothetical protein ACJA1H_001659, partial [Glaciecola sp.]